MANDSPLGDLVNFEDDERLDKPDALALQVLGYEALADDLGGLLGECSGVIGWPTFGTTPTSAITIGECVLVGSRRRSGSTNRPRAVIHPYNPLSTYQSGSTTVDVSAYDAADQLAYIWFARTEMLADIASRRKFAAGVESTFNPNTRKRTRIIFGTSLDTATPPDEDNDWYVFAQIVSWAGSVPTIEPFHPFEPGNLAGAGDTNDAKIAKTLVDSGALTDPGVRLGFPEYLDVLRRAQLMQLDSDWTFDPDTGEVLTAGTVSILGNGADQQGNKQLAERLDVLEDQPSLLLWGRVTIDAATPSFANLSRREVPVDADAHGATGVFSLGCKSTGQPVVNVTPSRRSSGDFTGTAPTHQVQILAGTGAGVNWVITVRLWDNTNAAVDSDFHITAFGVPSV